MFGQPNADATPAGGTDPRMTTLVEPPPVDDPGNALGTGARGATDPSALVASRVRARRTGRSLLGSGWTRAAGLTVAVVVLAVVVACSVAFGAKSISFGTVWQALVDFDGSNEHQIVRSLRVPRTLLGLGVGAALGLAGAVMQGVTRNPLADPGILGVDAGAALAVAVAIYSFGISSLDAYIWFAFAGAAVASALVYLLGSLGREGATPVKLALAGAALSYLLRGLTQGILLFDVQTLDQFRFWIVGSLAGRDSEIAAQAAPFLVAGAVLALLSARALNTLSLGDDVARSLGQRVHVARGVSAVAIVVLCGAATAAAGPIAFVGLTVPHVARAICGPDYRWILPWSLVLAPTLLLGADVIGRLIARPGELQVGIVTAFLGAPFFVALVRRRKTAVGGL
jgi:iron complex transport system permease protein